MALVDENGARWSAFTVEYRLRARRLEPDDDYFLDDSREQWRRAGASGKQRCPFWDH